MMFDYEMKKDPDGVVTVTLRGRLELGRATTAFRNCMDVLIGQCRTIVLDVSELRRVDSAGLGELVWARSNGEARGSAVHLGGTTERIGNLLILTKLAAVFGVEERRVA